MEGSYLVQSPYDGCVGRVQRYVRVLVRLQSRRSILVRSRVVEWSTQPTSVRHVRMGVVMVRHTRIVSARLLVNAAHIVDTIIPIAAPIAIDIAIAIITTTTMSCLL